MPTRYRKPLRERTAGDADSAQIVLTATWGERCLSMYPLPEWEIIEHKLIALPSLDATSQRLKRLLLGHASELEFDKSGRMLIPAELREYAFLEKQIMLVGQGNKFEVWDQVLWDKKREEWMAPTDSAGHLSIELEQLSL